MRKTLKEAVDDLKSALDGFGIALTDAINPFLVKKQEKEEEDTDMSKCPECGGEADNGHDRVDPPNPYVCTKCERKEQQKRNEEILKDWGPGGKVEKMLKTKRGNK